MTPVDVNHALRHAVHRVGNLRSGETRDALPAGGGLISDEAEHLKHVAREAILEAHGKVLIGAQAHDIQGAIWAGILPDGNGGTRLQFWDHHGFISSVACRDEGDALAEMINRGFLFPDPGALSRLATTDAFCDGNHRRGIYHWNLQGERHDERSAQLT